VRVELHDGNHAELRDELTGGDRRAAKGAVQLTISDDGARTMTAELEDRINYALLRRLIVSWTLPQPLPRDAVDPDTLLDDLPLDDVEALCAAVKPHYDRILSAGPKAGTPAISGTVLATGSSTAE
jgi:hypothetical protein